MFNTGGFLEKSISSYVVGPARVLITVRENHPLVPQVFEKVLWTTRTQIKKDLVPKASVEKVKHRVFGPAHIQVHPGGAHPIFFRVRAPGGRCCGIDITQVVPTGPGPLGHGVGFPSGGPPQAGDRLLTHSSTAARGDSPVPVGSYFSPPATARAIGFRHRHRPAAAGAMNDGNGLAPIPLAGEHPIPQPVIHGPYEPAFFSSNHFVISR
jgi:hypothetical protein